MCDHLQKKKTGNTPVEFKALRMFPEWERWIVPKPTFLGDQLLKEAAILEEQGEPKNRVKRHNIFEHYKEGFEPHTLSHLPGVIQAFKEYKMRSSLNPDLGNLWGCFWGSCNIKEKGFWMAALEHHARHSLSDEGKVYHAIGAPLTAKQDSDKQQDTSLTSDSAMDYLIKAPGDQSFADFQKAQAAQGTQDPNAPQDAQTAQAAVTAQNVQVQQDPQAVSDAHAAQDSQTVQDGTQPTTQVQGTGALDLDDADDAAAGTLAVKTTSSDARI